MNHKHKLFLFFSLAVIFFVLWYPKSKDQYINKPRHKYIENMDNIQKSEACCDNNPLFLAMKNSADISILKEQVKELSQLREKVRTLQTDNENNTKYLNNLQQEDVDTGKVIENQLEEGDEKEQIEDMSTNINSTSNESYNLIESNMD